MSKAPLRLWVMPPCWGLPNASPFVMKLQTWLRMIEIEHETHVLQGPPKSPSGKVPYVEYADGSLLSDSSAIIGRLSAEHGVALDDGLDPSRRAQALLLQRLFEDHLYWALATDRWRDEQHWPATRAAYFEAHLPLPMTWFVPSLVRRQVLRDLWGQGFGRMPLEQVHDRARADLAALACLLGTQEHFLGRLSSIDATALGFLGNIWLPPMQTATKQALSEHSNLVAYVERGMARWWP